MAMKVRPRTHRAFGKRSRSKARDLTIAMQKEGFDLKLLPRRSQSVSQGRLPGIDTAPTGGHARSGIHRPFWVNPAKVIPREPFGPVPPAKPNVLGTRAEKPKRTTKGAKAVPEGIRLKRAPYSDKNLAYEYTNFQPYKKDGWIVSVRGEYLGTIQKTAKKGLVPDVRTGPNDPRVTNAVSLLDEYYAAGGK